EGESMIFLCRPIALVAFAVAVANPAAANEEYATLASAYNTSGQDIYRALARHPGNIVFSPLSVGMAMAMALSGARGETESEMRKVLRHELSSTEIETANADLLKILKTY